MKGGYKIIDFKNIPLSDSEHPALVPDLRATLDENYNKAVLLTNVVLGDTKMDDCFSTVVLKSNNRIKLNSYDGYITVDANSYAHYTEGGSGDPTAEIEEIKEDISDIQSDIGDLTDLSTEEKSSLVGSINEVDGKVDDVADDLGDISDLDTTDKTSAVNAINEVNTKVSKTEVLISNSGDAYDPTRPYKVGEYCIYNDTLYRCTTACSAGSWATNQSCFTQDTLVNVSNRFGLEYIGTCEDTQDYSGDLSQYRELHIFATIYKNANTKVFCSQLVTTDMFSAQHELFFDETVLSGNNVGYLRIQITSNTVKVSVDNISSTSPKAWIYGRK